MKKIKGKKAFTIVELVIVIAVIAILATVLVPTFGDVITNAKDSAAKQAAKNAFTGYLIHHPEEVNALFLYDYDNRFVTVENGAVTGIYPDRWAALSALTESPDESKLTQVPGTGLWIYDAPASAWTDWSGASAFFVGDSITAVTTHTNKFYYEYLQEDLQLGNVNKSAYGGSCYSEKSDYGANNTPLIKRYQNIPDADLIVIFMGTNDYGHETPLGNPNDTGDISFYGALNTILPSVQAAHPDSQLVVMTPLHRYGFGESKILGTAFTYDHLPNGVGASLSDYVDAIKEVCAKNSISVIDLYSLCALDPQDTTYFNDGLHPNTKGHEELAKIISEELKKIPRKESSGSTVPTTPEVPDSELGYALRIGNRFGGTGYEGSRNRACNVKNLYLKKGTIVTLKENGKYDWAISPETSYDSTNTKGQYLTGTWDKNGFIVISQDGWYGFTLMKETNADFDFSGADPEHLLDYFVIAETAEMQSNNRFAPAPQYETSRLSSTFNLYLPVGTTVTLKTGSAATHWAISKTSTAVSSEANYQKDAQGNPWRNPDTFTVNEAGYYGFVFKNDSLALDPDNFTLFDLIGISGYLP